MFPHYNHYRISLCDLKNKEHVYTEDASQQDLEKTCPCFHLRWVWLLLASLCRSLRQLPGHDAESSAERISPASCVRLHPSRLLSWSGSCLHTVSSIHFFFLHVTYLEQTPGKLEACCMLSFKGLTLVHLLYQHKLMVYDAMYSKYEVILRVCRCI